MAPPRYPWDSIYTYRCPTPPKQRLKAKYFHFSKSFFVSFPITLTADFSVESLKCA